ncbi:hypothetical protein ACTJJ0_20090 [Chitinophaga sp. 22321]|uniref:DUF4397 domain-containing protein n=1 Tax=Chitinophaga hostae TaxID=2831022 RepID=A0ABS5IXF6_9BACT|nr:hypothetical protein [Chitinophaga hostae]MBS0027550.1 hypothetical protein [Chitinophaga hostae]
MKTTYILIAAAMLSACSKKLDYSYDNRVIQYPVTPSAIRLINLYGATDLSIGSKRLTSYAEPDREGVYGPDETRGTIYFPETGRLGLTFTIPRDMVKNGGWVDSIMFTSLSKRFPLPLPRPLRAKDDDTHPNDYYFAHFRPNPAGFMDSLFVIPRGISPAADPAGFKIRLLNLSSTITAGIPAGIFRNGPMSLTLADGTTVPGLSNVAPGKYSDYVEMPYGTYQFKVLDNEGKEVPATGSMYNLLNPITGTLMDINGTPGVGGSKDTWLTYAPLKTFQPGGIYTIVVTTTYDANIPTGNPNGETYKSENNTFRIIADIPEPVNITYARLQGVNAAAGKKISWQVDGQALGGVLAFAKQTTYNRYITGMHTVKALGENGQVLAESNLTMQPADNLTAWLYTRKDGSTAISFSANNLSGKFFDGTATDNGSYAVMKDTYPFWLRFMNFCPDLEEVSFTQDNGQPFKALSTLAFQHIYLGKPATDLPYVMQIVNFSQPIMAYASAPGVVPGNWLRNITPLRSHDFIAHPELYKTPEIPQSEPGVYTVALVGSTAPNATEKARMIIVKHNN